MPEDIRCSSDSARANYDPLVIHARRELWVTLIAWTAFAIWVVGLSWWLGREPASDPDVIPMVWGIPHWVFWGVALPWILANIFTFWFCFRFMVEDRLEEAVEEDIPGGISHKAEARKGFDP